MIPYVRDSLLLGGRSQYSDKVLATDPIAYWLLDEKQGTVAYDSVVVAQNGAHTGVTLGQPGIGDGRTSPLYDGINDYTDIYSATFSAAFNGAEGSIAIWARVANVGIWTDGNQHDVLRISAAADTNNQVEIYKAAFNNRLAFSYNAGGVAELVLLNGVTTVDWIHICVTWSAAADEMRAYYNGAQTGGTQAGLGVWAGPPANGHTVLGARTTVPTILWSGYLNHCAVWDRVLTPAEVADLAVVA